MTYRGFEIAALIGGNFSIYENSKFIRSASTVTNSQLWIDTELQRRRSMAAM
jgi:hypothetical protein